VEADPTGFDPAVMLQSGAAVIPSANFVAQVNQWSTHYELTLLNRYGGLNEDRADALRNQDDPRVFTDAVSETMTPRFRQVSIAPDLASAREGGARYLIVIDLWKRTHPVSHRFETLAGVRILDDRLHEIFASEHHHMERSPNPGAWRSTEEHFTYIADLMAQSMAAAMRPVLAELETAFARS
jgi:hypothetical protein